MPVDAALYPVNLVVADRPVLVVGGGRVAVQKVEELVRCGARVHVVAPAIDEALRRRTDLTWDLRLYRPGEAAAYRLVITTTDDPAVNRQVLLDGERAGVWVNSADDPDNCSFTLPSRLRRGPLLVTFSTGGHSPALATWLRRRFDAEIGPEYVELLDLLAEAREAIRAEGRTTEGLDWQGALDSGILELVREGRLAEAKERLQACLSS